MTPAQSGGGKKAGKTEWAGRRRPVTRRSGFSVSGETTGGELQVEEVATWALEAGSTIEIRFDIPEVAKGELVGFGVWFLAPPDAQVSMEGPEKRTLTNPAAPDWSKAGSAWVSDGEANQARLSITVPTRAEVAFYSALAGGIGHVYFEGVRPRLLSNLHESAPEGNFYSPELSGNVAVAVSGGTGTEGTGRAVLHLKSCNRCARFLPINVHDERLQLSFSNHCVAAHRTPCRHAIFGRLRDVETEEVLQLHHGYQLECRFCKKWTVNAVHNSQRTGSQMKEDGTRRRAFELLLSELYGGSSPSLRYRQDTGGRELAEDIYANFDGRCFKCGTHFANTNAMHLDHTRPLALLWPLDGTATALCGTHNSEKRDRSPSEYYSADELERLADRTGVPLGELRTPGPNPEAISLLMDRLDWFFDKFLRREDLQTVRDGKLPADLLIKALQKAISRDPGGPRIDLEAEYGRRT